MTAAAEAGAADWRVVVALRPDAILLLDQADATVVGPWAPLTDAEADATHNTHIDALTGDRGRNCVHLTDAAGALWTVPAAHVAFIRLERRAHLDPAAERAAQLGVGEEW